MASTNKKEVMTQLRERFPYASKIEIEYYGSGDNFDSFNACYILDDEGKNVSGEDHYKDEQDAVKITEDYMFYLMDHAVNQPDFNNDGSEGKVIFDLVNRVATLEVTYLEDVTPEFEGDEDDPNYDQDYDEYWDNVEREYEGQPMPPEEF